MQALLGAQNWAGRSAGGCSFRESDRKQLNTVKDKRPLSFQTARPTRVGQQVEMFGFSAENRSVKGFLFGSFLHLFAVKLSPTSEFDSLPDAAPPFSLEAPSAG